MNFRCLKKKENFLTVFKFKTFSSSFFFNLDHPFVATWELLSIIRFQSDSCFNCTSSTCCQHETAESCSAASKPSGKTICEWDDDHIGCALELDQYCLYEEYPDPPPCSCFVTDYFTGFLHFVKLQSDDVSCRTLIIAIICNVGRRRYAHASLW